MLRRSQMSASPESSKQQKVALILNGRARRVDQALQAHFKELLGAEHVFAPTSLENLTKDAEKIVQEAYDVILTAGGDGTFSRAADAIGLAAKVQEQAVPRFGFLKLGTGNALSYDLGASGSSPKQLAQDIELAQSSQTPCKNLQFVETEGRVGPFGGLGVDANILNDYEHFKTKCSGTPWAFLGTGLFGYFISSTFMSVPRLLFKRSPRFKVFVGASEATSILPDGTTKQLAPGTLLFDGPARLVAAATIPYYGYGLKAFPHAEDGQSLHLRIASLGVFELIWNLRKIWLGSYKSPNFLDFKGLDFRIESDVPTPFHIAGDVLGMRQSVALKLSEQNFPMLLLGEKSSPQLSS